VKPYLLVAMETPLVAVLLTEYGPLQLYSLQALQGTVAALPKNFKIASEFSPAAAPDNVDVKEGWGIEQWSYWGRKKSALASKICKENGALKARIADLEARISATPNSMNGGIDPLHQFDPWADSLCEQYPREVVTAIFEDAWAAWRPQRLQRGLVLSSLPAESSKWDDIVDESVDGASVKHRGGANQNDRGDKDPLNEVVNDCSPPALQFHGDWEFRDERRKQAEWDRMLDEIAKEKREQQAVPRFDKDFVQPQEADYDSDNYNDSENPEVANDPMPFLTITDIGNLMCASQGKRALAQAMLDQYWPVDDNFDPRDLEEDSQSEREWAAMEQRHPSH
jgi:hypothetical protein